MSTFCPLFENIFEKVLEIHVKPIQIKVLSSQRSTELLFVYLEAKIQTGATVK